jgi:hypothetical protein
MIKFASSPHRRTTICFFVAECLRRLQINYQLKPSRLLDGKIVVMPALA